MSDKSGGGEGCGVILVILIIGLVFWAGYSNRPAPIKCPAGYALVKGWDGWVCAKVLE